MTDRERLTDILTRNPGGAYTFEDFADYLLQNGVIVPPCKVGDTVYQTDGIRLYPSTIKKLIYETESIAFDESTIGKSIFLSREEAEKALKEREKP